MKRSIFLSIMSGLVLVAMVMGLTASTAAAAGSQTLYAANWTSPTTVGVSGRPAVVFDGSLYHMWYSNGGVLYHTASADAGSFAAGTATSGLVAGYLDSPAVWMESGVFYMINYGDSTERLFSVYTSSDGLTWAKSADVYAGAGLSNWLKFDAPFMLKDDGGYKLYFQVKSSDTGNPYSIYVVSGVSLAVFGDAALALAPGADGAWDDARLFQPAVVKVDGTYFMWYGGYDAGAEMRMGFASSTDGLTWTKGVAGPLFAETAAEPVVIVNGSTWHMWYMGSASVVKHFTASGPIQFSTIQAAIAAAVDGDTIAIAPGEYTETGQIVISKNLTLTGADPAITVLHPGQNTSGAGTGDAMGWFLVNSGKTLTMQNVTLDASGKNIRSAIRSNGSGVLDNVVIKNVYFDTYNGWGISYDFQDAGQNWNITNSRFENIQRVGILVDGQGNTATLTGNTFTGKGAGDWVNYGIEIGDGAVATITGNTFTGYSGEASTDGSGSAGVMSSSYYGPNPRSIVTGNTFDGNSYGLAFGYLAEDSSTAVVTGNTFTNNGIQINLSNAAILDLSAALTQNTFDRRAVVTDGSAITDLNIYGTIQGAVDAADDGSTIYVYPGSYSETATGRYIEANGHTGPYQFGLYIGPTKTGLTIQGVDNSGTPITDAHSTSLPEITTNATNSFGASGTFVEGDQVTLAGLEFLPNTPGDNKTVEVIGNDFTLKNSHVNVPGGGSIYINDWRYDAGTATSYIQKYTISGNWFDLNASLDISSGAGYTGAVSGRQITGNTFSYDTDGYWAAVSFNGTIPAVGWFVDPVGGAVIEGNTFSGGAQYIRSRGVVDYDSFNWMDYFSKNTFDKSVLALQGNGPEAREYTYTSGSYTIEHTRRIGTSITAEIANAQAGDTVLVGPGTYNEDVVINKAGLKVKGAGYTQTVIVGQKGDTNPNTVTIAASNATLQGVTVTRDGNDLSTWTDPTLNNQGVSITGSGNTLTECLIKHNRNGVYINNQTNNAVYRNIIDDNRTGMQFVGNISGTVVSQNYIIDNWTLGILLNEGSALYPTSISINGNYIDGNWYADLESRYLSGGPYDFTNNWLGTVDPLVMANTKAGEPGYTVQIPVEFGGTSVKPRNTPDVAGLTSEKIDFTPWLSSGLDLEPATMGFQPDLSSSTSIPGDVYIPETATPEDVQFILDYTSEDTTIYLPKTVMTPTGGFIIRKAGTTIIMQETTLQPNSPCFTVAANRVSIKGVGTCYPSDGADGVIVNNDLNRIVIQGLEITGSTGAGINLGTGLTDVKVLDNWIHGMGKGLVVGGNVSGTFEVQGNRLTDAIAIENNGTAEVNAEYNDWGSPTGKTIANVDTVPFTYAALSLASSGTNVANKVLEGGQIQYTVMLDARNVSGAEFTLYYDPAVLQVVSTTDLDVFSLTDSPITTSTGTIHFSGVVEGSAVSADDVAVMEVVFKAIADVSAPTDTTLNMDEATDLYAMVPTYGSSTKIYGEAPLDAVLTVQPLFSVSGKIDLQGRVNDGGAALQFALGLNLNYGPFAGNSDSWGKLLLALVPEDTYTLSISRDQYLDVTGKTVTINAGKTVLNPLVLIAGDVTSGSGVGVEDNAIDLFDVSYIGGRYNTSGAAQGKADLTGDGKVNIYDLSLVGGNYNATSATAYGTWVP